MSSQLETPLGTNLRNDATAENSTNVKLCGSEKVYKLCGSKITKTKVGLITDIRKYKGRLIALRTLYGHFHNIETCLFKQLITNSIKDVTANISNKGQAGWDPLGTHAIASSLESLGRVALQLGEQSRTGLDQAAEISNSVSDTIRNALQELLPGFNKISTEGIDVNFRFSSLLDLLNNPASALFLSCVIYLFIEIVDRKYNLPCLKYIKLLLGAFMVFKIGVKAFELVADWFKPSDRAQSGWTDWLSVTVQGICFILLGATVETGSLLTSIRSLSGAATNTTKLQELFTTIVDWFKNIITVVCEAFGLEVFEWMKPQDAKIKEFMKRVTHLNNVYTLDPMSVNFGFAEEVTRLLMEINDYMLAVPINSKNQPVINAVRNIQEKMLALQRNVADAGMSLGERNDPAFIPIAGAPGIGKTYLSDFLSQEISMHLCESVEEIMDALRSWKSNVYVWPTDGKHHDQYKGEKIVVYPDLFCQTDAEGQPSEATSLVYLVGGQPVQLNAAELTKKQRLYFISQVMLACTNTTYIYHNMFKSVRNADAVKRRLDAFGWYMWVDPKYAQRDLDGKLQFDPNTQRIRGYEHDDELYAMLDKDKIPELVPGMFPPDLWHFRRLNFSKGEFADDRVYDYQNFTKVCKKYITMTRNAGDVKRASLSARADMLAEARIAALVGEAQIGDIESVVVAKKTYVPYETTAKTAYELDREMKKRVARKDKLDILRLSKEMDVYIEKKYVEETADGYTTAEDSSENVAQMDNTELHREHHELRAGVDFCDLDASIGVNSSSIMKQAVESDRYVNQTKADYLQTFRKCHLTAAQHARIREVLTDAKNVFDVVNIPNAVQGLAMYAARSAAELSPRRKIVLTVLREAIYELERDVSIGHFIKTIGTKSILDLAAMDYEHVNGKIRGMQLEYMYKTPFLASINKASEVLSHLVHVVADVTRPAYDYAMSWILPIYYDHRFQAGLDAAIVGIVCYSISFGFFVVMFKYLQWQIDGNNKKKIKLDTKTQGTWEEVENTTKTINKHMDNFCGLYIVIHGKDVATRHPCNIVFLGGKTAVIVNHVRQAIMTIHEKVSKNPGHYIEIAIVPFSGSSLDKSLERFRYSDIVLETNDQLEHYDLAIIKFKNCVNRPHMHHLIPPKECMEHLSDLNNLTGIFIERTTDLEQNFRGPENRIPVRFSFGYALGNYATSVTVYKEDIPLKSYEYQTLTMKGIDGIFTTRDGYCTSPGFLTDSRKNYCEKMGWKQAQNPWLCYLHTSLQGLVPNGVPIFKELFTKWIEELSATNIRPALEVLNENMDVYSQIVEEELKLKPVMQSCSLEIISHVEPIDENHISKGIMKHGLYTPGKSEIQRSKMFGIDPVTRFPARMGTFRRNDGTIVDVMKKAREPYGTNNVLLNGVLIEAIIHQAMARVKSDSSPPKYTEELSLDQCLYGDGAYKLNSINWNSSAGFYFRMMKEKYGEKWSGKRWMLDDSGFVKPDVKRVIQRLFDYYNLKIQKGERIYGVNIDNIKDELLKKEKVKNGDSRLFCTNDLIHLLLCKSKMGAFAGWIFENRINNGIAIGVNPLSDEWDAIVTAIINNSPDCIFMDHSKFDKNQIRQIMRCVLILMDMFYNDAGRNTSRARETLFEDILESIHVMMYNGMLYFYCWSQGNTSGNFLTAILNSLVNICYIYICAIFAWLCYQCIDPNMLDYLPSNPADKALKCVCLGDDIVVSIKRDMLPGVNFNTIKMTGKYYLNIDITDELKTEGIIPDFRKITEGSFLGRGFEPAMVNNRQRFIGKLRKYSILEKVQWVKGNTDPEIEIEKVESAFLEMSLYPRGDYEDIVRRYAPVCERVYGVFPRFTDYDVARRHILTLSEYKYSFNDFMYDESCVGLDIGTIISNLEARLHATNYKADVVVNSNTIRSSDFEIKYNGKASLAEAAPPIDIDARHKVVNCISEANSIVGVSTDEKTSVTRGKRVSLSFDSETKENKKGKENRAQMDNGEKTDFEQVMQTDQKAVTTFYEAAVVEEGTSSRNTSELSTYIEQYDDIKAFLLRPTLIANGAWTTGQAANVDVASGNIAPLLTSVPMWARKVEGFNLIRGDFMIKVQLNASPFHQGKLLLHYIPNYVNAVAINPGYPLFHNADPSQKIQHPHLEVDCRKTSVVMRIPYVAPTPWYSMKEGFYDWGSWWLTIFSPLRTGAAGQGFVDYAVYAWWENMELSAPTVPQSSNKEIRRPKVKLRGGEVKEAEENQGPITMGLRKTAKVANVLSEIPVLSSFAKPVEWVSNILSNATSILGWSKPRELDGQMIVAQQLFRYAGTCDGPDLAYPGGVTCLNRLETIDYGSFTTEDEMSLNYLYKIPYYVGEFNWNAGAGPGTSLLSQKMSPLSFLRTGSSTFAGHVTNFEYHVPFTYLARMHRYWRGGLILTLKFIKTQMHSGRLQVTWIPCNLPNVTPGLTNSNYNKRAIVDIRTEDTISLELPYMLYSDYIGTTPIGTALSFSGQLDIQVLNDIRAPETCSQGIGVQWFISAADDYELSAPSQLTAGSMPFQPQSDGKELIRDSVQQGMEFPTLEIGGTATKNDPLFHARRCIGEKTMSIKSYLLRNSVIQAITAATFDWTTSLRYSFDPWFIGVSTMNQTTGAQVSSQIGGDHFSLLAPMYAFFRGGMRYTITNGGKTDFIYSNVIANNVNFGTQPYSTSYLTKAGVFGAQLGLAGANGSYPLTPCNIQDQAGYVYQHIPYYNKLPFSLTSYYDGSAPASTDPAKPVTALYVSSATNFTSNIVFQRAVADDFQLMFFIGCPPLAQSYA